MNYGFSFYLDKELDSEANIYIKRMAAQGFSGIFTSIHLPEDQVAVYRERLLQLAAIARENQLQLVVDVAADSLERIGLSVTDPKQLRKFGITGLRLDEKLPLSVIINLTQELALVALNASTLTLEDVAQLKQAKVDFSKLEAWHNYYPRPETGLAATWFSKRNHWLRSLGIHVQAFVPGDGRLRGPLFAGLPTLEEHRKWHPLAAVLALAKMGVSTVYLGDPELTTVTQAQFALYLKQKIILLHIKPIESRSRYFKYVLGLHQNRLDPAAAVIRCADSRQLGVPQIVAEPSYPRTQGAVTLDNEKYQRYMGEIQLCRIALPADERVNVVGQVLPQELTLLNQLGAGESFELRAAVEREELK
ncbi:MupG family TIM beta-alpha barrel fold protein [Liquorilactobacillus satsumensis]|uniref:MupG family TIM beta-alpha barrel fold protein n=1 Tax=Liquorilactobacillus satsumensis TaxID=259059 RepID=UPI0039EB05AD